MSIISQYASLPTTVVGNETIIISSPLYGLQNYLVTIDEIRRTKNVTQAQRLAITGVLGQVVYQTDATEGLYVWKSTGWAAV
jgi:hypothetical protein